MIDHANGNTLDNRLSNLRIATRAQNRYNGTTRKTRKYDLPKGVVYVPRANNRHFYQATIHINQQRRNKLFKTPEEASKQYKEWAEELHGEFAYHLNQR